jgi:signal transduction histidine kinase
LAIVERIMKALQGSVLVDKAPGGGALFVLIFPLAAVLSSVPKQEQPLAVK